MSIKSESMTEDADGEDDGKRSAFTFRRELDSVSAVRVREQPVSVPVVRRVCQRLLGLCSDDSLRSLSIRNNSSHLDQNNKRETLSQPTTARRCVKRAKITSALPFTAIKIKAYAVPAYIKAEFVKAAEQSDRLYRRK